MYRVKKNSSGKWIIINDNAKRASKAFDSKSDAISYANNHYKGNYTVEEDYQKVNISLGKGKNKKTIKLPIGLAILLAIIVIVFGLYYFGTFDGVLKNAGLDSYTAEVVFNKNENKNDNHTNENHSRTSEGIVYDDFQIHFLELGNEAAGDSVFIKAGDVDILIDAGSTGESATTIKKYVDELCTDGKLEYVIATHNHTDHIAAFAGNSDSKAKNYKGEIVGKTGIFYYYEVGTLIDFAYATVTIDKKDVNVENKTQVSSEYSSSSLYGKYLLAREYLISNGTIHYTVNECFNNSNGAKSTYNLTTNISMNILYNYYYFNTSSDVNNYSVCTMFNYNNHHFMLTGDLEKDGEEKLANYYDGSTSEKTLPHVDLFKAGHHGSKTSSNECLLSKITPDICCVCCCAGNNEYTPDYNNTFPTQEFINRIAKYTDKVYVTSVYFEQTATFGSLNGNITVSCDEIEIGLAATNNLIKLKDSEWFNGLIYLDKDGKCSTKLKQPFFTESTEGVSQRVRRVWPN